MSGPTDLRDDEFRRRVLEADGVVLVQFWAPWCGPCRRIVPLVADVAEAFRGRVQLLKVNTDENPKSPGEWDIPSIPAFLLFYGGKEVRRWVGRRQAEAMPTDLVTLLDEIKGED